VLALTGRDPVQRQRDADTVTSSPVTHSPPTLDTNQRCASCQSQCLCVCHDLYDQSAILLSLLTAM